MQHLLIHAPDFTLQAMTISHKAWNFNLLLEGILAIMDSNDLFSLSLDLWLIFNICLTNFSLIMEKSKSFSGYSSSYTEARFGFEDQEKSYSFNGPSGDNDAVVANTGNPEMKRRKRVAAYNMYAMEGKFKSSMRNSFKWIKNKFSDGYYDD
ncbi:hypothetical protein Patl1_27654 [Pistacia atlantica]|uniref:Uncharacterized protein n=1 Tax=Pistacia atlantica TaxID=434234 RepID=A0ACC1BDK2_9ROSI|nr:hypothetical protein Patl1_27654 [Pistacia atlantica]